MKKLRRDRYKKYSTENKTTLRLNGYGNVLTPSRLACMVQFAGLLMFGKG